MEILNPAHSRKFLIFCGSPYEECLCEMTLKTGFQFIAWVDIIFGLLYLLLMISVHYTTIPDTLISILGIALGVSALIGLIGIRQLKMKQIIQYAYAKQIYLLVVPIRILAILLKFIWINNIQVRLYLVTVAILILLYNILTAKLIWSALVRLENNESLLVFYGKRTLLMMMQQGGALSNMPGVIAPEGHVFGTPIESDDLAK